MAEDTPLQRQATKLVDEAIKTLSHPDKRRRVALRRALGKSPEDPAVRAAHMVVAPVLPMSCDQATERAFYAVASMIAAQPRDARDNTTGSDDDEAEESEQDQADDAVPVDQMESLGATLGRAVGADDLREKTMEARLHLMCRQDLDGIHRHLPRLIATLRAELLPVSWTRLTIDLARWGRQRDLVTKRWLQDYYRKVHDEKAKRVKNKQKSEGEDQ
ncbi:type I-E CRISPR-associated protein Cse2/CasB [Nonomuraea harbinensis]|uniref:Type I-E CRISPR-associated protein Cse2/CasB n=1 Tax=Nonomuraea harbinensis TaxID=1286938 RepID=A0ABW1C6Z5_9ACTN|nr:type I-E CRISPR-associated protein Cse2/CasB [Nonomuraea harbinensis]